MTIKLATIGLLTAALAAAPLSSAHAEGWHHHGGGHYGHDFGLFAGVAAITGAAVAVATLPFRVVGEAVAPEPVYAAPAAPAYYGSGYYAPVYPQQRVVYAYPQAYPAPVYYGYPQ